MMVNFGFDTSRIVICNDSELIFRGLVDEPGLCIVAGTGSIVFGFSDDGRKIRAGGWGAPLSDQGSGYWIGAEIFRRYLDWFDGIEKWNEIFFEIEQLYGRQDPQNIAAKLACMDYSEVASFARIVMDTANRGNQLCCEIVSNAAEIISKLVISVYPAPLKENRSGQYREVGSFVRDQYLRGKLTTDILSFTVRLECAF
jgi:N-acetylglucosamine kinase-like BadF-type ATPase